MYILVGQEAAKIFEVKVGGRKKICQLGQLKPYAPGAGWTGRFFINLQLWPLIFLQPLDLQECTVPHFKDLIYIWLEPEAQGCGMTFNMFYVGSKYPYFISYRGQWVFLFCHGCSIELFVKESCSGLFIHKDQKYLKIPFSIQLFKAVHNLSLKTTLLNMKYHFEQH